MKKGGNLVALTVALICTTIRAKLPTPKLHAVPPSGKILPRERASLTSSLRKDISASLRHRGGQVVASLQEDGLPAPVKLCIGVGGIYGAFMYYGVLQEAVFLYRSADGGQFKQVRFLMALESLANVIIGFTGMHAAGGGGTKNLPKRQFAVSGASQVCAKACTNLALRYGVSFPVVTLAKSGKMVPVMIGSILLGGAKFSVRDYLQALMIIGGTCMVSMAKKKSKGGASSAGGIAFVALSLAMDGVTAGLQKRIKNVSAERGVRAKPYDFMFWTNAYMLVVALAFAAVGNELGPGFNFCTSNPQIMNRILNFALLSAIGQSFIFYTISNFEPIVCSTVTTTRKIFSVLLSIFLNNHALNAHGWAGISIACAGILDGLIQKW